MDYREAPANVHVHVNIHVHVHVRASSTKHYQGGGTSVIIMKGGHDQMKGRCGFYSKLEYCEGIAEEFGGEVGQLGG